VNRIACLATRRARLPGSSPTGHSRPGCCSRPGAVATGRRSRRQQSNAAPRRDIAELSVRRRSPGLLAYARRWTGSLPLGSCNRRLRAPMVRTGVSRARHSPSRRLHPRTSRQPAADRGASKPAFRAIPTVTAVPPAADLLTPARRCHEPTRSRVLRWLNGFCDGSTLLFGDGAIAGAGRLWRRCTGPSRP